MRPFIYSMYEYQRYMHDIVFSHSLSLSFLLSLYTMWIVFHYVWLFVILKTIFPFELCDSIFGEFLLLLNIAIVVILSVLYYCVIMIIMIIIFCSLSRDGRTQCIRILSTIRSTIKLFAKFSIYQIYSNEILRRGMTSTITTCFALLLHLFLLLSIHLHRNTLQIRHIALWTMMTRLYRLRIIYQWVQFLEQHLQTFTYIYIDFQLLFLWAIMKMNWGSLLSWLAFTRLIQSG